MNRVFIDLFAIAATRRYEAAGWLRRMVGVVGARDLPEEPTEEEFRLGLRNGIVLCNALNKVQPGAVPKVSFSGRSAVDSLFLPLSNDVIPPRIISFPGGRSSCGSNSPSRWCCSVSISVLREFEELP